MRRLTTRRMLSASVRSACVREKKSGVCRLGSTSTCPSVSLRPSPGFLVCCRASPLACFVRLPRTRSAGGRYGQGTGGHPRRIPFASMPVMMIVGTAWTGEGLKESAGRFAVRVARVGMRSRSRPTRSRTFFPLPFKHARSGGPVCTGLVLLALWSKKVHPVPGLLSLARVGSAWVEPTRCSSF